MYSLQAHSDEVTHNGYGKWRSDIESTAISAHKSLNLEMVQDRRIATIDDYWETQFSNEPRVLWWRPVIIARRRATETLKATRLPQQYDIDISLTKAYDTTAMLIRYPVALFGSLPISQNVSSTPLP